MRLLNTTYNSQERETAVCTQQKTKPTYESEQQGGDDNHPEEEEKGMVHRVALGLLFFQEAMQPLPTRRAPGRDLVLSRSGRRGVHKHSRQHQNILPARFDWRKKTTKIRPNSS